MKMQNKKEKEAAARAAHKAQKNAAKKKHKIEPNLERAKPEKPRRKRILIYCEGENTEPSYFNQFALSNTDVKSFGEGHNTLSLIERAMELRDKAIHLNKPYDEIWCVFDRDPATSNKTGHTAQNFNKAIQLAKKEKIEVAYSNQAFEYWLILHFLDHQGGKFPRTEYNTKLNKSLKPFNCKYDGNSSKIVTTELFDVLESKEPKTNKIHRALAIIRAEKIYNRLDHSNPANEESSTTIFKLVKRLLKDYP